MQLNSTIAPVREMDQQHPPPPPPLPPAIATVHRYAATPASSARQGLNTPDLVQLASPPLPMRLSEVRLLQSQANGSPGLFGGRGRRDRTTGLRSNPPSRSNPNEYVDEPVFSIHDRSDGKPVPSSSSSSSSAPTSNPIASESNSPSKDKSDGSVSSPVDHDACKESIFCPRCQRCRCIKCQQTRRLPAFRCGLQCLPEQVVDCCSCIWCARAAYRRCSHDFDDDDDGLETSSSSSSEALCACTGRSCCRRWTVLAVLTPCLPCLCLYWPLQWLLSACSACYNCRRRGCHCAADARRGAFGQGQAGALLISDELLSSNSSSSA